jgi:hypothetical protein
VLDLVCANVWKKMDWVEGSTLTMITCKQASHLVSERHDRKLNWRERLALRLHLWICANCQRFERQLNYIKHALHTGRQEGQLPAEKTLPPESAERIRKALHAHKDDYNE